MKLNKKQKRTATIASMAALLAVVLGMGGQTFAKYIETNETGSKTAVVAKWGVVIQNSIESASKPIFEKENANGTVIGKTQEVVAPGTEGSVTVTISGTPEVASRISFNVTIDDVSLKDKAGTKDTYYPIVWSVSEGAVKETFTGANAQTNLTNYLVAKEYAPNLSLDRTVTIGWSWAFEGDNAMDTICGNAAANTVTANEFVEDGTTWELDNTIGLSVVTTVEQIKEFSA